jgi:outer membrane protein TolC
VFEIRGHQCDYRFRFGRVSSSSLEAMPVYGIEQAVALAQERNPEILIAHKKVTAARGGFIEARSGYLPSLSSSGLYDKRQTESQTNLRQEDYNAIVKLEQNLYTGGAVGSQVAIAQLNIAKANYDLQETISRVTMDVRIAFNELLLNGRKSACTKIPCECSNRNSKASRKISTPGLSAN